MNHIKFLTTLLGRSSVICTLAISVLAGNAVAKEGDLKQELKIAAVSQRADVKNNQIIFNGPVKITQGSINIEADELRAFSAENGQTKTLIATGNPATFSQELDDGRIGTASANEIRYDLATTGLLLTGNAKLDQAGSKVTGNVIRYNINAQELIAESTGKGEDRVITIIQPENFQNDASPAQKLPEIPLKKQGNQ
ncbi:lipopolysaccharide transport periplasmic protein LptA [Shewanella sp. OMA3-2]|uniref:lipopolysaccharide transport periplasmic protein LptA n=1 Tax=Shewanella sp. OMA3-2 TaxID=2908650 RepID=UPI001F4065D9|nr:lipopolysaccharide transport periplasmic protein LptA [Shewanella sp. OMA3-2]UJF21859.1 lipopolysaccharide transport periplasmic protein LptA [Shewanella sp. OMA3-2]